ncbi:MAG: DJ-1/PfpI family protein [Phycisphaerae bacterium]|nr:DJ-1/PfpI family protein [Saprospiraceae bacterium]
MFKINVSTTEVTSIGVILFDDFDSLDVAGPNQVFYWLSQLSKAKPVKLYLIGPRKNELVNSMEGMQWTPKIGYDDAPKLDLIFIPGGYGPEWDKLLANTDHPVYAFLKSRVNKDTLVCSVCVGALVLANAGLLKGYNCTTHWALKKQLALYPGVTVAPGFPRYVIDGKRITGGGISSGMDEALAIVEVLRGAEIAKQVQLMMQYAPNPPFNSGDPSVASAATLYALTN